MAANKKVSDFDKLVEAYIHRIIRNDKSNIIPELEIRYTNIVNGEFTSNVANADIGKITQTDYTNVARHLVSLQYIPESPEGIHMLRIYLEKNGEPFPFRCEIYGLHDIQQYCRTNDWTTCSSARFVKKVEVVGNRGSYRDYICSEFGFKMSLKDEITIPGNKIKTEPLLAHINTTWGEYNKAFRRLNRITYSKLPGFIKVDMSEIQSSARTPTGSFVYTKDFNSANIKNTEDLFEIEIEFNNQNIKTNYNSYQDIYTYISTIINSSRDLVQIVLCGLYQTEFPITKSEMKYVLLDYYSTVYGVNQNASIDPVSQKSSITKMLAHKQACDPNMFTGPSQVSVQFENLLENTETPQSMNVITSGYAVSDKADGERCIMLVSRYKIDNSYKVYLIDMNMRVRYTGIMAKRGKGELAPSGTLIDGEYVKHDKYGTTVNIFLAFDIYNYNYTSVRNNPFIYSPNDPRKSSSQKSRSEVLLEFQTSVNLSGPLNYPMPFTFLIKPFLVIDETTTIYSRCREVLAIDRPYTNDGLIFTHQYLPVGSTDLNKSGPLYRIRWIYSFKWKPPQFNTVDFLVTSPDNNAIHSLDPYGVNNGTNNQIVSYKKLELRCGFLFKKHGVANAFDIGINEDKIAKLKITYGNESIEKKYIPMLFYPSWFPTDDAYKCNVVVKPEYGTFNMYAESGDVVEPNTIVECRYDPAGRPGFKWIPLRIRPDKTATYLAGGLSYGNDYTTANNVWKSIHAPITEEIITTGNIPEEFRTPLQLDEYYQMDGKDDARGPLQMFHNHVKHKLLESVATVNSTLIDLSCGRGGDLYKWIGSKVAFVFGIDFSSSNIENMFSGAYFRYLEYRIENKLPDVTKCLFVTGDSSKNIQSGEAFKDDKNKQLAMAVYGKPSTYNDTIGELNGIGNAKFSVASCQFSIHYFFKDLATLGGFITNVSQNLKMNGKFIATCFDGKRVFEMLEKTGEVGEVFIMSATNNAKLYWKCVKKYTSSVFNDDSTSLGYGIDVFQKSIGHSFLEYLVNGEYFIRVMEQYGFKLDSAIPFEDIYKRLPRSSKFRELDKLPEKIITFLNVQYTFTKVVDIDPLTVVLEDLGSAALI